MNIVLCTTDDPVAKHSRTVSDLWDDDPAFEEQVALLDLPSADTGRLTDQSRSTSFTGLETMDQCSVLKLEDLDDSGK